MADLARLRAAHLKAGADAALAAGNAGDAARRYGDALEALPAGPSPLRAKLLSNRSAALTAAGRCEEALADARAAAAAAPSWAKPRWRAARALAGLRRHVDAVLEYGVCAAAGGDARECRAGAARAASRAARGDLGLLLLALLAAAEADGRLPRSAISLDAHLATAALADAAGAAAAGGASPADGAPPDPPLPLAAWAIEPPSSAHLLLARSRLFAAAAQWEAAAADAAAAAAASPRSAADASSLAADAALRLGVALLATPDQACRNAAAAAATLAPAVAAAPSGTRERAALAAALAVALATLSPGDAAVIVEAGRRRGEVARLTLTFAPGAAPARSAARAVLAAAARVPPAAVAIDRVRVDENGATQMTVELPAVAAGRVSAAAVGSESAALEPAPQPPSVAPIVPSTALTTPACRALVVAPSKPSLVTADGRPAPATPRHPFALSRVHHASRDVADADVWVQAADGSLRWRQSAAWVSVLALRVPRATPAVDLDIVFSPRAAFIALKSQPNDPPLLDITLDRAIVPAECAWTHGGGEGEDGTLLLLSKANLELWADVTQPATTWWPRLVAGDGGGTHVEWDDFSKDYSDLPPAAAAAEASEAVSAADRAIDGADRALRRVLREADGARRRARVAALHGLRWGTRPRLEGDGRPPWAGAAVKGGA